MNRTSQRYAADPAGRLEWVRPLGHTARVMPTGSPGAGILQLQRQAGNAAVARALQRSVPSGWVNKKFTGKAGAFLAGGVSELISWTGLVPKPDWAGRAILERYLSAGGDWTIRDDPAWSDYMMSSDQIRQQVFEQLLSMIQLKMMGRSTPGTYIFVRRFHADTGISTATPTGYGLLNGTNSDVGDFLVHGTYSVVRETGPGAGSGGWKVVVRMSCSWHDKIDRKGWKDLPGVVVAKIISLGVADSYQIEITWNSAMKIYFDAAGVQDRSLELGWPSRNRGPVTDLPAESQR